MDSRNTDAGNRTRLLDRKKGAEYINSLSRDELFERFGITRVGNITGFDTIGVPVYHVTRPAGLVLSQNSGKGEHARVGAIGEGIEYGVFEQPTGEFRLGCFDAVSPDILPLARGSKWNATTEIPLEPCVHFQSECTVELPSDLLWMVHRKQKLMHFQMTSNGQALGASFESALLGGLYECIERDAMTIALYRWKEHGQPPCRVDFSVAPDNVLALADRIAHAGLKLFLFETTSEFKVPVYCAFIVDPSGDFFTTTGWGCDIMPYRAAEAAILEAIQSRCVYIAGARDDLLQKEYDIAKARDPREQMEYMEYIPFGVDLTGIKWDAQMWWEIEYIMDRLGTYAQNVYYKLIDLGELKAVKTVILGLEPPIHELWKPSERCSSAALACTA
jgi:ribosomal protein S12 methylthiotransferase accessory factor